MHGNPRLDGRGGRGPAWLGGLPRRDLVLLPLLALATLVALLAASEIGARAYAPAREQMTCLATNHRMGFSHGRPGCSERGKIPEGDWVTYAYNACGYRSPAPCGAKPAGVRRIALLGSSFAAGYVVPYQASLGGRLQDGLTARCRRPVEVQNLAALGTSLVGAYHEMDEALALHPDLLVLALLPFDLEEGLPHQQVVDRADPPLPAEEGPQRRSPLAALADLSKSSRALVVARHFLFADRGLFVRTYLMSGDKADFLRQPFTPLWQQRFADLDLLLGEMAARARAAGVPMALLLGPQRAQLALMGETARPPGVDPDALPRRLAEIAGRDGIMMIDTTQAFAPLAAPETLIYTVDGHPSAEAHGVIAEAALKQLAADRRSPFAACEPDVSAR